MLPRKVWRQARKNAFDLAQSATEGYQGQSFAANGEGSERHTQGASEYQ